ncbi:MAG: BMP family ABC transporter substrate-binding protein, partial [Thermomicrobiales bacterium]|nr:BMP family ABC transporter substrate-binding protein [Thermomicrobiales bacterium]
MGSLAGSFGGARAQDATPTSDTPLKVAFVYVGPIGDMGWTFSHDEGRLALEEAFPNIETVYQESVPENPADAER